MENMTLLTPKERGWVKYHLALAATRDWDFETFTHLFMKEIEPVEDFKPVNVQPKTFDEAAKYLGVKDVRQGRCKEDCSCDACWRRESAFRTRERAELLRYCRNMSEPEYIGLARQFGKTKNFPEYHEKTFHILVTSPGYIPELYGSDAVNLFIPGDGTHIRISRTFHGKSGHNKLYFGSGTFYV